MPFMGATVTIIQINAWASVAALEVGIDAWVEKYIVKKRKPHETTR